MDVVEWGPHVALSRNVGERSSNRKTPDFLRESVFEGSLRSTGLGCPRQTGLGHDGRSSGPLQRQDYRERRAFSQRAGHIDASLVVLYDATGQGKS